MRFVSMSAETIYIEFSVIMMYSVSTLYIFEIGLVYSSSLVQRPGPVIEHDRFIFHNTDFNDMLKGSPRG